MEPDHEMWTDGEVVKAFKYFKRVKRIFLVGFLVIIGALVLYIGIYGLDVLDNPTIVGFFGTCLVLLFVIDTILMINFKRKLNKIKEKYESK